MEINVRQFSSDKILKHLDRVDAWLKGENPYPITVELDMTNICNHRCPMCTGWRSSNRTRHSVPISLAKEIIAQLASVKVRGIIFTGGGEPLCHPNIKDAVKDAYISGLDIGFITNGSLINEDIAGVLLKYCIWVRISLDAASRETFKKIHGLDGSAFDRTLKNIALLARLKQKLKTKTTIGVGYLTCDSTLREMHDMALLCRDLNVDYLQFRPMQIRSNGKVAYHSKGVKKEINKCLSEGTHSYKVLYSKHKYDMMEGEDFGRFYDKCYGQQFATVVAANGRMFLCCHMRGHGKYCIGDLRKNTFEEIWNSKRRKDVVENVDFKDCIPLCRDNTFNQVLWNIKQPREHVNFL